MLYNITCNSDAHKFCSTHIEYYNMHEAKWLRSHNAIIIWNQIYMIYLKKIE